MSELIIRGMTEEDWKEMREMAALIFVNTMRPNQTGPRWDRYVTRDFPIYKDLSLGNMTQYKVGAFYVSVSRLFVGIENRGAYTFEAEVHWQYAMEKLRLLEPDARNVADWINAQLGHDVPEQGSYEHPALFRENARQPSLHDWNGS